MASCSSLSYFILYWANLSTFLNDIVYRGISTNLKSNVISNVWNSFQYQNQLSSNKCFDFFSIHLLIFPVILNHLRPMSYLVLKSCSSPKIQMIALFSQPYVIPNQHEFCLYVRLNILKNASAQHMGPGDFYFTETFLNMFCFVIHRRVIYRFWLTRGNKRWQNIGWTMSLHPNSIWQH